MFVYCHTAGLRDPLAKTSMIPARMPLREQGEASPPQGKREEKKRCRIGLLQSWDSTSERMSDMQKG